MVRILLDRAADPNLPVCSKILLLETGVGYLSSGFWHRLSLGGEAENMPIYVVAYSGDYHVVKLLLESGLEVHACKGKSGTALYFAVIGVGFPNKQLPGEEHYGR
jgi:hypothetical protein